MGGSGTLRALWLKLKELHRVNGMKRKRSEVVSSSSSSENSSKKQSGISSGNSACGLLGALRLASSDSSSCVGIDCQSQDIEIERTNSPNGPLAFEMDLDGSFMSDSERDIDDNTSNGTPPPPLEPHLWASDSGLSVPSTSTAGLDSSRFELIDLTMDSSGDERESGISGDRSAGSARSSRFELSSNWLTEMNWECYADDGNIASLKNVADIISSVSRRFGAESVRDKGTTTTLYVRNGKVVSIEDIPQADVCNSIAEEDMMNDYDEIYGLDELDTSDTNDQADGMDLLYESESSFDYITSSTESDQSTHADEDKTDCMMVQNTDHADVIMIRDTGNDHANDEEGMDHANKINHALVKDKTDVGMIKMEHADNQEHADKTKIEIDCGETRNKTDYDYDDELQYDGMNNGYDVGEMIDGHGADEGVQEQCVQRCPGSDITCPLSGSSHDLEVEASQPSQSGLVTDADSSDSNSEVANESPRLDRSHL